MSAPFLTDARRAVFALAPLGATIAVAACGEPPVGPLRDVPASTTAEAGAAGSVVPILFARDIRPLMTRGDQEPFGCMHCHYRSGADPQGLEIGGLDLSTLGELRRGGVSSKTSIVVPGDPAASALVQKLEGTYPRGSRMPKDRTPWTAAEIALVRRWIAEGARGADDE